MTLSVFTPLPPAKTGIADYSETLLKALDDVEAVAQDGAAAQPFPVITADAFSGADLTMFHVGNSHYHDFLYPALFEHPGVLVLHDLVLHHARLNAYLESEPVRAYRADMGNRDKRTEALAVLDRYRGEAETAYPERGAAIAEIAIRTGGGRLLYTYPFYEDLVRASRLTLVHGTPARDEVRERCPDSKVERVRMGIDTPALVERDDARRQLGLGDELLLASFGLVTPEKRITMALRAVARLRASGVACRYLLVGGTVDHFDVKAEAEAAGVADAVTIAGRVSDEEFWLYAFASDLCLNLRYPSAGETSATLLRLLACGRPVAVTDQLHVSDFPDSVVARASLEGDEDGLYCDLMDLIRDAARRDALARNARAFVLEEHSVDQMASDYRDALGNI